MLSELKKCRQIPGEPRRRWFTDESFDLIVWYAADDSILGFQLCYDKKTTEHALTWMKSHGYSHRRVDTGEMYGRETDSFTPVLVPDGRFHAADVLARFQTRTGDIAPDVVQFVSDRVLAYDADQP